MAPLTSLLAVTSLVGLAAAIPAPKLGMTKGTQVHQVRNPNYVFNGPLSLYKTHLKYGSNPPEKLKKAVERMRALKKRDEGSATATSQNSDQEYTIPVSIGTPGQVLQLDLDTGSSDLWVFSTETESDQVNGQTLYDPSQSSSSSYMSGYTWSIQYGDQSTSNGDIYTDTVTIGGVTVSSQAVELAQSVSSEFTSDSNSDGLLGMAFDSINTAKPSAVETFFDNAQSSLDSFLFTADLKHDTAGSYGFGYIDSSLYTGDITYVDVDNSQGFWGWTSGGYAIGSDDFTSTDITGIADTGTTLLCLDDSIVDAYYNEIDGANNSDTYGGYVFPCSSSVPSFTFAVGSSNIVIPSDYMNTGAVPDDDSTCFGGLQSNSGLGTSIFGDVALKAAFVVFQGGDSPTLGWATKNL
ncbi:hypothetical protein SEPCBS119000_003648 [Sporothrix epigloea]|uniref:Peptidase A1 domain-containing protein n=1 Tax=Sporothrix epigloea TaxID=1892477 RepID=A0ABP0DRF1_9PEZI